MLATLGFVTIVLFAAVTLTKKMSVLTALIAVPTLIGLFIATPAELGTYAVTGIKQVAPTGVLIVFAVLLFSLLLDRGLFAPVVSMVLRLAGHDPVKVAVGTVVLTAIVALDGDGSSTYLIAASAMLPVYLELGMRRHVMALLIALPVGVMNIMPWGGPTTRVMAALNLTPTQVFVPMIPIIGTGLVFSVVIAVLFGLRERRRLAAGPTTIAAAVGAATDTTSHTGGAADFATTSNPDSTPDAPEVHLEPTELPSKPIRWFNAALVVALIACLVLDALPAPALFVAAYAIALLVNAPEWDQQRESIERHAKPALLVAVLLFAAGIYAGVLAGTGTVEAMARLTAAALPTQAIGLLPPMTALLSMPLSLVLPPDAFYYGVLPVLAQTGQVLGIDPAIIGRAALMGHTTLGAPISPLNAATFVLVARAGVDLTRHQRFSFWWLFLGTVVMTAVAILTGALTWG